MKNTYKIIGFDELCGDKFFNIAITDKDGDTHTDLLSEATLIEFARQMKGNFELDEENEALVNELEQLAVIEVSEEDNEFDVYIHKFFVDEDILEYDVAGKFLKTYKTEKGAMNFAKKQGYQVI